MAGPEFRVLGPLEVRVGDRSLDLGPRKQRAVLAALIVASPEVVAAEALIDRVWGEDPPRSAAHALQVYVSNLRRLLEPERSPRTDATVLVTRDPGYQLLVDTEQVDSRRFEAGLVTARELAVVDPGRAADDLHELLSSWSGPALADFADLTGFAGEASRLDALRLSATEQYFAAALAAGRHAAVVDELGAAARANPLREALWRHLILALYRCGRQADALRAYAEVREHLVSDLGIEPGTELRDLEAAVLAHDPSLDLVESLPRSTSDSAVPAAAASAPATPTPDPDPDREPPAPQRPRSAPRDARDERRVVAALFADLSGSTPLGEMLTDDEFKLVIDGAMERIVAACERYGGSVLNVAGDGVAVVFGAPVAHEDDAERAVLAGLEIVADVGAYGEEVARAWDVEPVRARVGINCGPVVTGLIQAGGDVGYNAVGDTMNTAARLESAAEPGTVLVATSVRDQLGAEFTFTEARPLPLRGKADPVEACIATGGRPGGGRQRGLHGRRSPLVGREAQLRTLTELSQEAVAGRGGAVFVSGEAGLGKSRLLEELRNVCDRIADPARSLLWLDAGCISYGERRPLWPARRLIEEWIGAAPGLAPMRVQVALRRAVESLFSGAESDRVYSALATLTGCDDDAAARLRGATPDAQQGELQDVFRLLLERLAADRPVVIAIDDLHWADDETLDLLEHLLPIIDRAAVLLAIGSRPEPAHRSWQVRHRLLTEFAHRVQTIELSALSGSTDGELLDSLVGPVQMPAGVRDQVLALADGNPFYVEELIRSLVANEVLVDTGDRVTFQGASEDVSLPPTVEQVIVSRLDRLDHLAREVLITASVVGCEFEFDLLSALVGGGALEAVLVELQRLALVREVRRWPTREYRFEHPLIQEAAYATLVTSDRTDLHGRVAAQLSARRSLDESGARLAQHLELAGDDRAAADAYADATQHMRRRGLVRAAHTLSIAGTRVVDRLGSSAPPGVVAQLGHMRVLGKYYFADGELPSSQELSELVELARQADDPLLEARVLWVSAMFELYSGDPGRRRQLLVDALNAARRTDDLPTLVDVLSRLTIDEANALELDVARARAVEAVDLTDGLPAESRVPALDARKLVALYLGELGELAAGTSELLSLHPEIDPIERFVEVERALLEQARGDVPSALAAVDRALELADDFAGREDRESFLAVRCRILRSVGSYGAALDAGREAWLTAAASGNAYWMPWTAAEYGALLMEIGAFDSAVEVLTVGCTSPDAGMPSQQLRCAGFLTLAAFLSGDEDAESSGVRVASDYLAELSLPAGHTFLYSADAVLALAERHARRGLFEEAAELTEPYGPAAERAGWLEHAARARYVLGLIEVLRGDAPRAEVELNAAVAQSTGRWPGIEWRSHLALGGLGDDDGIAAARRIVVNLAADLPALEADALLRLVSEP